MCPTNLLIQRVPITALAVLAVCGCGGGGRAQNGPRQPDAIDVHVSGGLLVTDTGVGPFRYDASIARLRDSWPTSRPTGIPSEGGTYAAVELSRPGARVVVEQFDTILHAGAPGDLWYLSGDSITLPKRLRPDSRWSEFRKAYGQGWGEIGEDMEYSTFTFCSIPYLFFTVSTAGVDSNASLSDPASIPDTARALTVFVDREKTHFVPCDSSTSWPRKS